MVPLGAEILTEKLIGDERAAVRRTLRLGVSTYSSGDVAMALILNISETGLLIETVVELAVSETLQVDIPEATSSTIRVIWTDNLLAGCEFVSPVPTGAVSAARLKSSVEDHQPDREESSAKMAIVIVTSIISVLAIILFLAAVLPLR